VRENKGGELYAMLEQSCQTFVAETMKSKVESGIQGSVGLGGDGGVRAVECIESCWAKWISQLVLPLRKKEKTDEGTYSEYFLLLGSGAYSGESEIIFYHVCNI